MIKWQILIKFFREQEINKWVEILNWNTYNLEKDKKLCNHSLAFHSQLRLLNSCY